MYYVSKCDIFYDSTTHLTGEASLTYSAKRAGEYDVLLFPKNTIVTPAEPVKETGPNTEILYIKDNNTFYLLRNNFKEFTSLKNAEKYIKYSFLE
jgi:hypothetical protein